WNEVGRRLGDLGAPDVDNATLHALSRVETQAPRDLRLALETSLLAADGRNANGHAVERPADLDRVARSLRALTAPDERLPVVLERRVRLLIERIEQPPARISEASGATGIETDPARM